MGSSLVAWWLLCQRVKNERSPGTASRGEGVAAVEKAGHSEAVGFDTTVNEWHLLKGG